VGRLGSGEGNVTHLICPLCGLSVPLSKLYRGNFPIDLKTISFRNAGYRKGFAPNEPVSVMGDEEITPVIASRVKELYDFFVEHGEITPPVNPECASLLVQLNEVKRRLSAEETSNLRLETEMDEREEDCELDRQVDYVIRSSLSIRGTREQLAVDDDGWKLVISARPGRLERFLLLLMPYMPGKLKGRLLSHIDGEENPVFYRYWFLSFPMRLNTAQRMLDSDNENTVIDVDESGRKIERVIEPREYPEFAVKSIGFEELKRLVKDAVEHSDDLGYIGKMIKDVRFPEKLKLPLFIGEESNA
jgi:hypothetical protein